MSLRSKRRNIAPMAVVDTMLDSIVDAATGGAHDRVEKSSDEKEFQFPTPGTLTPEEEEQPEYDESPLTPIHESVDILEAMTGDRSRPPMRFCPTDPPAGSKPYDPGALSKYQQRRLNHLKRGVARDDQRYLSQHPEIGAVCALLLSAILREQPLDVRDFCSKWVKRPEMRHDVDEFLLRYPPPSRHDDIKEIHDWFPEPGLEEEKQPISETKPAEEALKKIERAQRRSRMYDHRATMLHSDLIREGAEDMVRRWLDDMLTTALSHRTEYWEHFEDAQELVTDERKEKKKTDEEREREEAEIKEAEKAVTDALKSLHKRVEVVDTQKKAGVFAMEAPGEEWVETEPRVDMQREETQRVEAVAEALQKLRTVSRGGPSYMAALSDAITRLQEHRAGELDQKPAPISERALRWSAIVRGERASVLMSKLEMEEKARRMAAAVKKTDRKKSEDVAVPQPGMEEEDEDEEAERRRRRKEAARRRKTISKKDLEEYNLRLSLVFPELADMLRDEGDGQKEVKDLPFQEQMAAATKDALELATKRFREKTGKRPAGRRGGPGGTRAGREFQSADISVSGEATPDADTRKVLKRRRQKRLPTAVVFEGLDPGQMKEKLRQEAQAQFAPSAQEEELEGLSEMDGARKREEGEEEVEKESDAEEASESPSDEGSEFQEVTAEAQGAVRDSKSASDKLRTPGESHGTVKEVKEEAANEKTGEPPPFEQIEEKEQTEKKEEQAEKELPSSVSTKPLTPDPPTPGDTSD